MFLFSSWSRASKRTCHSWMVLMVDECAAMAPPRIPSFVEEAFKRSCGLPATGLPNPPQIDSGNRMQSLAGVHPSGSSASSAVAATSISSTRSSADELPAKAHAWAAVVRLLCEGGDWVRAVAVVEGLPLSVQQTTRHKAVRDEWPLPRSIRELWRRVPISSMVGSPIAETPRPFIFARTPEGTTPSSLIQSRESLVSCRTAELLRIAYSLSRPRSLDVPQVATADASTSLPQTLQAEQQRIVAELCRRGAVLEVVQCVVNWQRRQLASPVVGSGTQRAFGGARGEALDEVKIVKATLFPSPPTCWAGSDAGKASGAPTSVSSAFERCSGQMGGRVPLYTHAHLQVIRQVSTSHPILLARCLRDRIVVDRLQCHGGEAMVAEVALTLMEHITCSGGGILRRRPVATVSLEEGESVEEASVKKSVASAYSSRPRVGSRHVSSTVGTSPASGVQAPPNWAPAEVVAATATCWRALAVLLFSLHPYIHRQPKTGKEKWLAALLAALDETTRMLDVHHAPSDPALNAPGHSSSVTSPGQGSTRTHRGGEVPAALCDKGRYAIKAAVESVCSPLLSHEPQVRFLRLHTFAQLARSLSALGVPIPNALAQCVFLCMADTGTLSHACVPSNTSSDPAVTYFSTSPSGRWVHALAMVNIAHQESAYRVSPAHERAILSGLQSISIAQTWTSALRIVSAFRESYGLLPDERTLPTLLLNLKQQSWQDAFRVVGYVPGKNVDRLPPSVLRDLQLVALKHASWLVPLQLMTHLQRCHADGFMSYLYCLCSAARSGDADLAFASFQSLKRGRGRHAVLKALSPYNELTVAVAAVAMLDYGKTDALRAFSTRVVAMRIADDAVAGSAEVDPTTPRLTADGLQMAQAAHTCALLGLRRYEDLRLLLNECAEVTSLPAVLHRVVLLHCLSGLDHLRAPVRLIFDVVGYQGGALQGSEVSLSRDANQGPLRGFLVAVAADQQRADTFETRQRATTERRQHVYIPMAHQRRQKKALATAWGLFMREQEAALSPSIARLVAESMVEEGVGTEYLSAALL